MIGEAQTRKWEVDEEVWNDAAIWGYSGVPPGAP